MSILAVEQQRPMTDAEIAHCERSIPAVLDEVARANPDGLAVDGVEQITYGELALSADRIARALQDRLGPRPEPVGLMFASLRGFLEALFGVLSAGKLAMPLDAGAPEATLVTTIKDSGARLLLGDLSPRGACRPVPLSELFAQNADDLEVNLTPDSPALLLYTSGSTGAPKGIVTRHGSDVHSALMCAQRLDAEPGARIGLVLKPTFGAAYSALSSTLLSGATLLSFATEQMGLGALPAWIAAERVSSTILVSGMARPFVTAAQSRPMPSLRRVLIGSDLLTAADAQLACEVLMPGARVLHTYGSTESRTMCSFELSHYSAVDDRPVPVGVPEPGKRILLEDVEDGVGEILVQSRYLSHGYWGREDETARVFSATLSGERCYRTGDLGRIDGEGNLVLAGRRDRRVKVSGKRVELDAVERALCSRKEVSQAAVIARTRASGTSTLVGFVTASAGSLDERALKHALRERLPAHMVPGRIVAVDELPRLPSGKLDRNSLLDTDIIGRPSPADELEHQLIAIWEELLERPVGVAESFFDLGGDSLLAMELLVAIEERLSCSLTPGTLMRAPTIEQLAGVIRDPEAAEPVQAASRCLFLLYPLTGTGILYRRLLPALEAEIPVELLEAPWWDGDSSELRYVEELAVWHLDQIKQRQPAGPYLLAGYSSGGLIAYEIARRLWEDGEEVALLAVIDSYIGRHAAMTADPRLWPTEPPTGAAHHIRRWLWLQWATQRYRAAVMGNRLARPWRLLRRQLDLRRHGAIRERRRTRYVSDRLSAATYAYRPMPYGGPLTFIRAAEASPIPAERGWRELARGGFETYEAPGSHATMLLPPNVSELARILLGVLRATGLTETDRSTSARA